MVRLRWLIFAPLALALLVIIAIGALLVGSLPRHAGTFEVEGLSAPVTVRRDSYAIPFIDAANEHDGYFALGFVHAQDRLWQMELRRRVGAGRLAELVGAPGLEVDRFMRLLRLHPLAEAGLDALSPRARRLVGAYTAGVNAFLKTNWRPLPPEFWALWHRPEPWTDVDSIVWSKLMALDLAGNWRRELLRAQLLRELPLDTYRQLFPAEVHPDDATLAATRAVLEPLDLSRLATLVGPPAPAGHGSNGWVVDGTRTIEGGPLLANDPHLAFSVPGVWYLAGLRTPDLEVVGATLPGLPGFILGRTPDFAWGMTNTGSDVQDLIVEELTGAPATATRTPDGEAPLALWESTIACRGCPDEPFVARWSVNGPLVSDLVSGARGVAGPGRALALRWTALAPDDATMEAAFALPHSRNWNEFNEALAAFANPQQNVLYANARGAIGLVSPGRVPIRASGDGTLPQPGWEAASDWIGFIPFSELPRRLDPPDGLLANANNALVDDSYPYVLSRRWDAPYRQRRILELLGAERHSARTFAAMQTDVRSGLADALLPHFLKAAPLTPEQARWVERLRAWDREAAIDSVEMTVFAAWYEAASVALYADELGSLFRLYGSNRPTFIENVLTTEAQWCDNITTAPTETCPQQLASALGSALQQLEGELGPLGEAWAWGQQHPNVFQHDIWRDLGPLGGWTGLEYPAPGDDTTINAASYWAAATPPLFASDHGAGYRQVVDLAAPQQSGFATATGQVGHPLSRHYRDMTSVWREGALVPMVAPGEAASTVRLAPR